MWVRYVRERARRRLVPQGGRAPCFLHSRGVAHSTGARALSPGAVAARGWRVFLEAARRCLAHLQLQVFLRGGAEGMCSCPLFLPGTPDPRSSARAGPEPSASVCLCSCVRVRVGACTLPVAALPPRLAPLSGRGGSRAARGGSPVASSDPCALSEPVGCGARGSTGIFSVCMSLGAGGPRAPSPVCVPCLHGLLWFCVSCRVPPIVL